MLHVDSDFMLILAAVFSTGWKLFTSFHIPGTNINVAEFVFACMMVLFVIKVVPPLVGFSAWWDAQEDKKAWRESRSSRRK